ncbi:MAG: cofC [Herminiimonas sp.]|nr:cofC [Herminiimonas sp.]
MNTDCLLLIPVKSLHSGKSRLGPVFSAAFRRKLNEEFLLHMLGIAAEWPGMDKTVIVSPCEDVLRIAQRHGAQTLRQPLDSASEGLNAALSFALATLRAKSAGDILIVPCDLPEASVADLHAMVSHGNGGSEGRRLVIAADQSGTGTNGLFLPAEHLPDFHFGPNSNQRHREMAIARGLPFMNVVIPGLSRDIDTPSDYYEWRRAVLPMAVAVDDADSSRSRCAAISQEEPQET